MPTTYSFASYLPAAFIEEPVTLASTSYLTTAYRVRRGLFGRLRLVERPVIASYATTYIPSSYIVANVLHNLLPNNELHTNDVYGDRV